MNYKILYLILAFGMDIDIGLLKQRAEAVFRVL